MYWVGFLLKSTLIASYSSMVLGEDSWSFSLDISDIHTLADTITALSDKAASLPESPFSNIPDYKTTLSFQTGGVGPASGVVDDNTVGTATFHDSTPAFVLERLEEALSWKCYWNETSGMAKAWIVWDSCDHATDSVTAWDGDQAIVYTVTEASGCLGFPNQFQQVARWSVFQATLVDPDSEIYKDNPDEVASILQNMPQGSCISETTWDYGDAPLATRNLQKIDIRLQRPVTTNPPADNNGEGRFGLNTFRYIKGFQYDNSPPALVQRIPNSVFKEEDEEEEGGERPALEGGAKKGKGRMPKKGRGRGRKARPHKRPNKHGPSSKTLSNWEEIKCLNCQIRATNVISVVEASLSFSYRDVSQLQVNSYLEYSHLHVGLGLQVLQPGIKISVRNQLLDSVGFTTSPFLHLTLETQTSLSYSLNIKKSNKVQTGIDLHFSTPSQGVLGSIGLPSQLTPRAPVIRDRPVRLVPYSKSSKTQMFLDWSVQQTVDATYYDPEWQWEGFSGLDVSLNSTLLHHPQNCAWLESQNQVRITPIYDTLSRLHHHHLIQDSQVYSTDGCVSVDGKEELFYPPSLNSM